MSKTDLKMVTCGGYEVAVKLPRFFDYLGILRDKEREPTPKQQEEAAKLFYKIRSIHQIVETNHDPE